MADYEKKTVTATVDITDYIHRIDHENIVLSKDRDNRRMFTIILVLAAVILVLIAVIAGIVIYNAQFETVEITAEQMSEGEGNNYAVGGDYYGTAKGEDKIPEEEDWG